MSEHDEAFEAMSLDAEDSNAKHQAPVSLSNDLSKKFEDDYIYPDRRSFIKLGVVSVAGSVVLSALSRFASAREATSVIELSRKDALAYVEKRLATNSSARKLKQGFEDQGYRFLDSRVRAYKVNGNIIAIMPSLVNAKSQDAFHRAVSISLTDQGVVGASATISHSDNFNISDFSIIHPFENQVAGLGVYSAALTGEVNRNNLYQALRDFRTPLFNTVPIIEPSPRLSNIPSLNPPVGGFTGRNPLFPLNPRPSPPVPSPIDPVGPDVVDPPTGVGPLPRPPVDPAGPDVVDPTTGVGPFPRPPINPGGPDPAPPEFYRVLTAFYGQTLTDSYSRPLYTGSGLTNMLAQMSKIQSFSQFNGIYYSANHFGGPLAIALCTSTSSNACTSTSSSWGG